MLDVSDGLLRDAGRVATASGVLLDLDGAALRRAADELAGAADALGDSGLALRWVLTGGEDHPLMATFPTEDRPAGFRTIGRVRAVAGGGPGVLVDGQDPRTVIGTASGWDHYRS